MMLRDKRKLLFYVCLVFICGCSGGVKHYSRPHTDVKHIKSIAVLPFENYTTDGYADEKIGSITGIELLSRGIDVTEPGEVGRVLQEMRVSSLKALTPSDIQEIGEALKVDGIMGGSVSVYQISRGISVSYPEVSVYLTLYESATGKVLWSTWHTSGGPGFWTRHFGAEIATLGEVSRNVIKEAFDNLF
ncbi:MAG: hypothetical protein C4538_12145 [Nitrospiraceae bacterium]|nr:MAG: hypothetical protein C4538_12145 [Nitrospiraceae bacterium]